jgi:hypothetical protein
MLHKDDYNNKTEEFITQNNFTKLPHDITNKKQRNIRVASTIVIIYF